MEVIARRLVAGGLLLAAVTVAPGLVAAEESGCRACQRYVRLARRKMVSLLD